MSRGVTEAMLEAAIPAYAFAANIDPNPHLKWLRPAIKAALEAALLAAEPGAAEGDEHHQFVADPYRPGQCVNCGRPFAARVHDIAAAPHQSGESGNG